MHAQREELVDGEGRPLLLRGINLGNWFEVEGYMFHFDGGPQSPREIEDLTKELLGPAKAEAFWKQWRASYITEADLDRIKGMGFNSVRVPLHWKFFTSDDAEGFKLVDQLVGWAKKDGIYVILDMHCAPGGQTGTNIDDSWGYPWLYESVEDQELTASIWKRIAEHYRDNPTVLGYDLLNEPIPHYPQLQRYNSALEPVYKKITSEIRSVDTHHVIILGGAQWDSNFSVFGPPFDSNAMYTFHKYWTPPTQEVIQQYLDFRSHNNVPIWLGESGENTDAWIHDFTAVLEKNEIGWAYWPYKKLEKTSAFVSWQKPVYWDEIVAFAKTRAGTGASEKQIAARPSLEHSRAALKDLLQKVQFHQCQVNPGYLGALGLKVPAS